MPGYLAWIPFRATRLALCPATVHGTLHTIFAWGIILSLAVGCWGLGAILARLPNWRGWGVYSYLTGFLVLVFWGAFVQGASGNVAGLAPITGLTERLSALSHAVWLCALTVALLLHARHERA